MTPTELRPFEEIKPPRFQVRGWKAENFGKNSAMRVDLWTN
jgi:hypothetical protein